MLNVNSPGNWNEIVTDFIRLEFTTIFLVSNITCMSVRAAGTEAEEE